MAEEICAIPGRRVERIRAAAQGVRPRGEAEYAGEGFVAFEDASIECAPIDPREAAVEQRPISPLRVSKRRLATLALGDILENAVECIALAELNSPRPYVNVPDFAVLGPVQGLEIVGSFGLHSLHVPSRFVRCLRRFEVEDRQAGEPLTGVAELQVRGLVRFEDLARDCVQQQNAVRRLFEQAAIAGFRTLKLLLDALPPADVLADGDEMSHSLRRATDGSYGQLLGVEAAVLAAVDELAAPALAGADRGPELLIQRRLLAARLEHPGIAAQGLLGGVAGDLGESGVHVFDPAAGVGDGHGNRRLLDSRCQQAVRLLELPDLHREREVRRQFFEQVQLLGVEETRLAGVEVEGAEGLALHDQGKRRRSAVAELQRIVSPGGHARVMLDIVADRVHTFAQGARGRSQPARTVAPASIDLQLLEVAVRHAGVSHGPNALRFRVQQTDPRHSEAARLDRGAASLGEQRLGLAHAHDRLIDLAQHGVDAVQLQDAGLGATALGDVVDDREEGLRPARVDELKVDFDGIVGTVLATVKALERELRPLGDAQRLQQGAEGLGRELRLEVERREAGELFRRVAEIFAGAAIDETKPQRRGIEDVDLVEAPGDHVVQPGALPVRFVAPA